MLLQNFLDTSASIIIIHFYSLNFFVLIALKMFIFEPIFLSLATKESVKLSNLHLKDISVLVIVLWLTDLTYTSFLDIFLVLFVN